MKFDKDGRLNTAAWVASPNFYTAPNPREIIVMHYTAGYSAASAINTFKAKTSKASAHFVVEVDGAITQMVSTNHAAWHAGGAVYEGRGSVNSFSIGIEIVNPGYHFSNGAGGYLNWQRKPVSATLLKPFPGMTEAHDPWAGSAKLFWPNYPETQLAAVEALTRALLKAYPSIRDVVGHRDVDTVRRLKVDPGPAFPLRRYRLLTDIRSDETPAPLTMRVRADDGVLNVRGGPGTSFGLMGWGPLRNGDEVQVLERTDSWYRIQRWFQGAARQGWVFARYLEPVG
ncbi:N-acetylmuramoyl-L-alanine amidase [Brevundimonas sp. GCM10030266]|uniref:N-acetylmuramoyl-L-alanine amidase n=1 Tax=Brevundimonas sp. GCM10030266 TaxID=3273386 RepID=UPI0036209BA3